MKNIFQQIVFILIDASFAVIAFFFLFLVLVSLFTERAFQELRLNPVAKSISRIRSKFQARMYLAAFAVDNLKVRIVQLWEARYARYFYWTKKTGSDRQI
ncbi:MAG: hypothetical protein WBC70_07650 [Candidatus Aminicenantales bacterium]